MRREPDLSGAGGASGIAAAISASPSSVNLAPTRGSTQNLLQPEQVMVASRAPPAQLQVPTPAAPTTPQMPTHPLSGFLGSVVTGANNPKATAAVAAVDSIMKGAFSLFGKKKWFSI